MKMPTKEEFAEYVAVQHCGLWNMFDPRAMEATGLSKETYVAIMKNYEELAQKYPEVLKQEETK